MTTAGDAPKRVFPCPQCGQPSVMTAENRWRPFCCERCKLLDLGDWFSGRYSVPTEEDDGQTPPSDPTLQ